MGKIKGTSGYVSLEEEKLADEERFNAREFGSVMRFTEEKIHYIERLFLNKVMTIAEWKEATKNI